MRIQAVSSACVIAGTMLALGAPSAGLAQGTPRDTSQSTSQGTPKGFSVAGEVGARSFTNTIDPLALGKFQEYLDLRAGQTMSPTIEQLLLKYTPADSFGFYNITARQLFDRDQSVRMLAKRPGLYDFQVRWDRILHTYSTTARSPGIENNPGFNTLPSPRPDSTAWKNAPYIGAVRSQWDPVKVSLGLTPSEKLDTKLDYTRIGKLGGMPASVSFSGSSGPQREFVEPIDQTMNDFRVSQSYASAPGGAESFIKSWQLVGSYGYSRFHNAIKSTMVDNPQQSLNTFAAGAATSRVSLVPDNSAQMGSVVAAAMFPMRTRVTASVSGTWASQNDAFFPQTNNDSLARDPNFGLTALQRASLNGKTRTSTINLSATNHPVSNLTLAARYRIYDYSDQTPAFKIKALIVSDRTVTPSDSAAYIPLPFKKTNSDLSASYQLVRGLSLTAGYAIEDWKRDDQAGAGLPYDANPTVRDNVGKTTEKTPRVSLDYNGLDWLSLNGSFLSGQRRGDATYVESATEIIGFRRLDLADRNRKRVNLMAAVTPVDAVTVELNFQTSDDEYPTSQYGTQSDKTTMTGIDVDWSPVQRLSASVGYTHEDGKNILMSRFRTGAAGSVTFDNPTYKWTNTNKDWNTTEYARLTASLIPDKLDLIGSVSVFDGRLQVLNANPVPPSGGTATNILNATAENWPQISSKLVPIMLALQYKYSPDWALTFRYQYEKYQQTDFRTVAPVFTSNGLASGTPITTYTGDLPGTIGQVAGTNTGQYHFLSDNYHPYNAGWITLLVTFHPSMMPFGKGRATF